MAGFRSRKRSGGKITRTAAKSYRRHRRGSHCHKKPLYSCAATPGCGIVRKSRRAKGYCRKQKNTRRRGRRGGYAASTHIVQSRRMLPAPRGQSRPTKESVRGGSRRTRKGGLSPLSPASFSSSSSAKAADISGHFGAIVPGGPGHQGALPTASHELSQAGMNALQVGQSPSGATALMDPLRPKPFGGQILPDAFY